MPHSTRSSAKPTTLPALLKQTIAKKGIPTPVKAAMLAKISPASFYRVLNGQGAPNSRTYAAYAKFLGVPVKLVEQMAALQPPSQEANSRNLQQAVLTIQELGLMRILPIFTMDDINVLRELSDERKRQVIAYAKKIRPTTTVKPIQEASFVVQIKGKGQEANSLNLRQAILAIQEMGLLRILPRFTMDDINVLRELSVEHKTQVIAHAKKSRAWTTIKPTIASKINRGPKKQPPVKRTAGKDDRKPRKV